LLRAPRLGRAQRGSAAWHHSMIVTIAIH
jgi:hypothetical protein